MTTRQYVKFTATSIEVAGNSREEALAALAELKKLRKDLLLLKRAVNIRAALVGTTVVVSFDQPDVPHDDIDKKLRLVKHARLQLEAVLVQHDLARSTRS